MSGLYNFTRNLDPNFNIVSRGAQRPRVDARGFATGQPTLSDRPTDGRNRLANYMSGTNGQVKITVSTRTTDQKKINSAQLAFIDNRDFDRPRLLSLQSVNALIVQESTRRFEGNNFVGKKGELDNKRAILDRFKLIGVVSNNDTDTDALTYGKATPFPRNPRTFTIVTWGDCHLLNYWSNSKVNLRRYDECYLVLKRVRVDRGYTFQDDITVNRPNVPMESSRPIEYGEYYWQWVPYSCRRGSLPAELLVNKTPSRNGEQKFEVGSYIRVGHVHEYGDVGNHKAYGMRDRHSVARDVSFLHQNGRVRPFQFYLHLDDETRLT
jgi:hypothetical protein